MTMADVRTGALSELLVEGQDEDAQLAERHRPLLMLDAAEPFRPLAAGYAVYRQEAQSQSSKFRIRPVADCVIEYAIWYDWDIQHLYDLEHIWVHVDAAGEVVKVEASRHGARRVMTRPDGSLPVWSRRPVLYLEPGKHAHWADGTEMQAKAGTLIAAMCGAFAGDQGIHLSNRFSDAGRIGATLLDQRLARLKMKRMAFAPSFDFTRNGDEEGGISLVPWSLLNSWIPLRVASLVRDLPRDVPHLAAVFLDCGDTLANEETEEKIPGTEIVTRAEMIPGATETVHRLVASGYRLALVADGPRQTFENILGAHGLWDCFEARVISGDVGELKPSAKMFAAACQALLLTDDDRARTVMVGNNLERDILGANRFGLISIFLSWSKRRSHSPRLRRERPRLSIAHIWQLPELLERIELSLPLPNAPATEAGRGKDMP